MAYTEDHRKLSRSHDGSPLCKLLSERIEQSGLTRREISEAMASAMGDSIPRALGIFLSGETVLPFDRAVVIGDLLNIDIAVLIPAGAATYPRNLSWRMAKLILVRLRPPEPPLAASARDPLTRPQIRAPGR